MDRQVSDWGTPEVMIALINAPGLKSFSGLQMHTPNPPLGLAYIAGAIKEAGFAYTVIDGTGEALDSISPYPLRSDFMIQGLSFDQIAARIPAGTKIIGLSCMFSTLWPLTRDLAAHIRKSFPDALMLLGGEPMDGPRHLWWNFVSSSKDGIEQAKEDWRAGRFGKVPGDDEYIPLPEK